MKDTFTPQEPVFDSTFDVVCFSHLRWDFVFQRPQHLMSRFARSHRVFFIEEPIFDAGTPSLEVIDTEHGVKVIRPHLPEGIGAIEINEAVRSRISQMLDAYDCDKYIAWFYTPMMLDLTQGLDPHAVVFDCMDELSAFKNAPPELIRNEQRLMERADVLFTGGQSLYEAKRERHNNAHAFPSSVDVKHFARAMEFLDEVPQQAAIPRPRIGFAGVIDERLDVELLADIASRRPSWHFIMIGPVVKISEDELPQRPNIHYLGMKQYDELPAYLAGWDVAMMPFALNDSTRFISPTKTPEYLAAGLPVVSTPITDVVSPYGDNGLVHIAGTAEEFIAGISAALAENREARLTKVAGFLSQNSWDKTFLAMSSLIGDAIVRRHVKAVATA
jgi:glycosyltransferase involved in cell wall biosynthesis